VVLAAAVWRALDGDAAAAVGFAALAGYGAQDVALFWRSVRSG
jgi:hypothetical protein